MHIGLPFSENYRTARTDRVFEGSFEDWHGFFVDKGYLTLLERFTQPEISFTKQFIDDVKEPMIVGV